MEEVKEIVITGILNSAETAAVTNDPMHVESVKDSSEASMDDEYLLYEVEMKPGKGVLYVTQNLPVEMSRLQVLSDFISNEMAWDYSVFCFGRTLPRGDVEIWLHPEVAQHGNELNFSNGLRLCRLPNRRRDAQRSCIIYGVPIRFDLANFHDHFGDELLGVRRYNKRGTTEPTETVELVFDSIDTARGHYNRGHIYCWNCRFRCAPKFVKRAHICRVCKTVNPKHRPGTCVEIRCGQCSGPHATRDHPPGDQELKCPVCSGAHLFHQCPTQIKACHASVRQQRRSYAEVVAKRRHTPPQPKPDVRIPTTISELQDLQDNEQLRRLVQLIVEALLTGKLASLGFNLSIPKTSQSLQPTRAIAPVQSPSSPRPCSDLVLSPEASPKRAKQRSLQEQKKRAEAAMSRRLEARKQSFDPKQATLKFVASGLAASSSSQ